MCPVRKRGDELFTSLQTEQITTGEVVLSGRMWYNPLQGGEARPLL